MFQVLLFIILLTTALWVGGMLLAFLGGIIRR